MHLLLLDVINMFINVSLKHSTKHIINFKNSTFILAFEVHGKSSILQTRHGAPIHGVGGLY
jgi:hypothetical protein